MHVRRFGRIFRVLLLFSIGLSGCSQEEELKLDPGVSPFYPGVSESGGAAAKTDTAPDHPNGPAGGSRSKDAAIVSSGPIRPDEVEKQIRIAHRYAQKKESAKAAQLLDQVLAVAPLNREALAARGILALGQSSMASSLPDRDAATSRALELARTLRRAYETPKKSETELYARALTSQAKIRVLQGRHNQALAALKEAATAGIDPYAWSEKDDAMAPLRSLSQYRSTVKAFEESQLAQAREQTKGRLDKPLDFSFDFKLPNLEDKPVSLADFKGKVVLVDMWGTWCGPCREAIPRLMDFNRKFERRGLAVVGLTYEKSDPADPATRENIKEFVKQAAIPYPCLIGDAPTAKQVPDLKGFPTSLVLDRAGKVRLLITENDANTLDLIENTIVVLLAEPLPPSAKPK